MVAGDRRVEQLCLTGIDKDATPSSAAAHGVAANCAVQERQE